MGFGVGGSGVRVWGLGFREALVGLCSCVISLLIISFMVMIGRFNFMITVFCLCFVQFFWVSLHSKTLPFAIDFDKCVMAYELLFGAV